MHCPRAGHSGKTAALVVTSEITSVQTHASRVAAHSEVSFADVALRTDVISATAAAAAAAAAAYQQTQPCACVTFDVANNYRLAQIG